MRHFLERLAIALLQSIRAPAAAFLPMADDRLPVISRAIEHRLDTLPRYR